MPKPFEGKKPKKGPEPQQAGAAVRMAVGTCCLPGCLVQRRAEETQQIVTSGDFVGMECTWGECAMGGQMHRECFEKLEKELMKELMRTTNTMGKHEMSKAIWTSKYDMVRPSCRCSCSKGFFKPLLVQRGAVAVDAAGEDGEEPAQLDPVQQRKLELETKLAKEAQRKKEQQAREAEERARRKAEATERNAQLKKERAAQREEEGWTKVSDAGARGAEQTRQPAWWQVEAQGCSSAEQSQPDEGRGASAFRPLSSAPSDGWSTAPGGVPAPNWPAPPIVSRPPPRTFDLKPGDFPDMPAASPALGPRLQMLAVGVGAPRSGAATRPDGTAFPRKRPLTSALREHTTILEIPHGPEHTHIASGLIGKDGKHVKEVQRQSGGARVVIQQLKDIRTDSRTRDVIISGSGEQRDVAERLIRQRYEELVRARDAKRSGRGNAAAVAAVAAAAAIAAEQMEPAERVKLQRLHEGTGAPLAECKMMLRKHRGDENSAFEEMLLSGACGSGGAAAREDEEEEMLRRAELLSLEAAEDQEALWEAREAEAFLEAQQASLEEEDAPFFELLRQAQQASLVEQEEINRRVLEEEEQMLARAQQASLFEASTQWHHAPLDEEELQLRQIEELSLREAQGGDFWSAGAPDHSGFAAGSASAPDWNGAQQSWGGGAEYSDSQSLALAQADEEAAVASREVAGYVLAMCQAYVVDARTDDLWFKYTTASARRVVRDEAAAWGLASREETEGPVTKICVHQPRDASHFGEAVPSAQAAPDPSWLSMLGDADGVASSSGTNGAAGSAAGGAASVGTSSTADGTMSSGEGRGAAGRGRGGRGRGGRG